MCVCRGGAHQRSSSLLIVVVIVHYTISGWCIPTICVHVHHIGNVQPGINRYWLGSPDEKSVESIQCVFSKKKFPTENFSWRKHYSAIFMSMCTLKVTGIRVSSSERSRKEAKSKRTFILWHQRCTPFTEHWACSCITTVPAVLHTENNGELHVVAATTATKSVLRFVFPLRLAESSTRNCGKVIYTTFGNILWIQNESRQYMLFVQCVLSIVSGIVCCNEPCMFSNPYFFISLSLLFIARWFHSDIPLSRALANER